MSTLTGGAPRCDGMMKGGLQIHMCISGVSKRHVLAYMEQWSRKIIKELKHRVAKHHGNICISQSEVMLVRADG